MRPAWHNGPQRSQFAVGLTDGLIKSGNASEVIFEEPKMKDIFDEFDGNGVPDIFAEETISMKEPNPSISRCSKIPKASKL